MQSKTFIPFFTIRKRTDAEEQPTCAICLCELDDGDMIKELRCKHIFHSECIDPWLINERAICPVCRQGVYLVEDWVCIANILRIIQRNCNYV